MKSLLRRTVILLLVAVVAYVAWDRVEAHRLADDIAAIAARGEPISEEEGFPVPATAEQREASRLYAEAADAAQERAAEDNNRAARLDIDRPGGAELSLEQIRDTYRRDTPELQLLDRATPLDFHGFDREAVELDHYQVSISALGMLACLRADLIASTGDGERAAAALVPCITLQRTLYSPIYRSGYAARIVGSLRIFLRHTRPSLRALDVVAAALESWSDDDPTPRAALLMRASLIDFSGRLSPVPAVARLVFHPFVLRSARRALEDYKSAIGLSRQPWPARWRAADEMQRSFLAALKRREPNGLTRFMEPFSFAAQYGTTQLQWAATDLAARRVAATVIAVERYRRVRGLRPASLDSLVPQFLPRMPEDPYNGRALAYKQGADDYTIYSVDTNRIDDGGELYGFGSAQSKHVGPQSPRDFGIRVPLSSR